MSAHTKGPWRLDGTAANGEQTIGVSRSWEAGGASICEVDSSRDHRTLLADARLIAAAPDQHEELIRFLPIIERAESNPEIWEKLTKGLGIATANSYRAAIAKAKGEQP